MRKMPTYEVTQERLKELVSYDPDTGKFAWLESKRGRRPISHRKYCQIRIDGRPYLIHRLAWIYMHGSIPFGMEVDHKNRDTTDTRIENLRLATSSQNRANRIINNSSKSGLKGAHSGRRGGYCARITCQGKVHHLGSFQTAEEAHAAYVEAAQRLFGEFARAA
jgi:hypothetical protein